MSLRRAIKRVILPTKPRIVTIPFGLYCGLRLKIDFQYQSQFYLGLYEAETNRAIRSVLHRAKWFIDIGAGMGELSILFKRLGATVVAVEPWTSGYPFYENLRANNIPLEEISVVEKPVGNKQEGKHISLDAIQVDHSSFGFIKIDVDGGELDVLRSGIMLLANARPALLVETHSIELEQDCIRFLHEFRYRCEIVKNAWWRAIIPDTGRKNVHNRWFFASG
jgi:hypothetical protein